MPKLQKALSASRIKTLQSCSWLYYCKYVLKLPEDTNQGALMGTVCHAVFELIGEKKHKAKYDLIIETNSLCKVVKRYVEILMRKYVIPVESFELVQSMILNGLKYDFFGKDHGLRPKVISEFPFDLEIIQDEVKYKINGYIDKLYIYKDQDKILIRDFKTSKAIFEGKDVHDNMQDLIYRLAISKIYPEFGKVDVEFVFVKPDIVKTGEFIIQTPDVDNLELEGLEYLLTEYQDKIEFFNFYDATESFAASKGYPGKEEGFSGLALCGRAKFAGQLKKDGNKMWHCQHKFPYDYFSLQDKDGKILRTSFSKEELKNKKEKGQKIKAEKYLGCPYWNRANYPGVFKKSTEVDDFL